MTELCTGCGDQEGLHLGVDGAGSETGGEVGGDGVSEFAWKRRAVGFEFVAQWSALTDAGGDIEG